MTKKQGWGFDLKNIDAKTRPQDDFYQYANGGWLASNTIPAHESKWGSFWVVQERTDKNIRKILDELRALRGPKKGSPEQMVRDVYAAATDMQARRKLGTRPIEKYRALIRSIASHDDLSSAVTTLHKDGTGGLWWIGIDQDSKRADRYVVHLVQGGLGLPERDYYLKNDAEQKRVRAAYEKHIVRLSTLAGMSMRDAKRAVPVVMRVETALARISMSRLDLRDPDKTYHKFTPAKLQKHAPAFGWKRYLASQGVAPKELIVMQPEFMRSAAELLQRLPIEDWKTYLEWHLVNDFASTLTPALEKAQFDFYGTTLTGTKKMKPRWRIGLGTVNGVVGEQLGKLYVRRFFSAQEKRKVGSIALDVVAAYEARIKQLDWMSAATKRRSLAKLHAMRHKIAYPDKWLSFRGLTVRPDDHFGNLKRSHDYEWKRMVAKLGKPVDRDEWFIYPQLVNAFYSPNLNDVLFCAGILQHPFFDQGADDALNYAGIGSIVGHELTHGFDDEGSKFDAKGNLKNWWTPKDRKLFEKKADVIRRQYDRFVVEGLNVNGKLTLGENIADIGGVVISYDAYMRHLERTGREDIDGFTPEQRFFLCLAQIECALARPEVTKLRILTDTHSPAICRVNGPLSNITAFYEAFSLKKGDKLYRTPAARETVW